MFRRTDRAYLAGLIDGEGSIGISVCRVRTPFVRITITNTNLNLLSDLRALWGGNLSSWRKRKSGWKMCSDLIWAGSLATNKVIKAILPYVRVKREQCKVALLFNKTVGQSTRGVPLDVQTYRQELRKKLLELNKRGKQSERAP